MRSRAPYSGVFALLLAWVALAIVMGALMLGVGWVVLRFY
jgi:hypothetical protein